MIFNFAIDNMQFPIFLSNQIRPQQIPEKWCPCLLTHPQHLRICDV